MSDDLYEPWQKLIRLHVLGKVIEVPEKNILLRQFQYVAPDIGMGRYCWNGECRYCEVSYRRDATGADQVVLACLVDGQDGMRITKLAPEVRYNLSSALASAPRVED
jgi:hypothetical protein